VGLRPLLPPREVGDVFRVLEEGIIHPSADWKGRYKQNLDKMKSGRLAEIADVLKNLSWVQKQKSLSFREKKMYDRARYLIISEIAHINGLPGVSGAGGRQNRLRGPPRHPPGLLSAGHAARAARPPV
jgi:CarD family transcriptional regulator